MSAFYPPHLQSQDCIPLCFKFKVTTRFVETASDEPPPERAYTQTFLRTQSVHEGQGWLKS